MVGDELARLQRQLLGEDGVGAGRARRAVILLQADDPVRPSGHAVHQLEPAQPVIVLGAGLDHYLLERRDLAVAAGAQNLHRGRHVTYGADEIVDARGVPQSVGVDRVDAVGVVGQQLERAGQDLRPAGRRQRRRAPGGAGEHGLLHRLAHAHGDGHARAWRRLYIPAVDLDPRRQPGGRRVAVRDVDPLHPRRAQRRHVEPLGLQGRGAHAVGEAVVDRGNVETVRPDAGGNHLDRLLRARAVRHDDDRRRPGRRADGDVEPGIQA